MNDRTPWKRRRLSPWVGAVVLLAAALAWAYWPTLVGLVERWSGDPQYSHGYVVPLFAGVVLWSRRRLLPAGPVSPSAWGLALLAGAAAIRVAGTYFYLTWVENVSLLPALAGLCVLAGDWPVLRWAWPAVAFLLFMLPLPFNAENLMAGPLRRLATACSTYALQTAGLPAVSEGTVIVVEDLRIGVADACSGLGMLFTFFALSTAVAFVVERPGWQKAVVFLSAVPVGVAMNLGRVAVTAFLFRAGGPLSPAAFHDAAGWVMMPAALALLLLELRFLDALFVEPEQTGPVPVPQPVAPPHGNRQPPHDRTPFPCTGRTAVIGAPAMLPVEPKDTAPSVTTMPATPGEPPAVNAPPSMGVLAQALRRCWGRALTLSLLAAALAVGAVLVALPPQYSAVVLLQVSSRAPRGEGEPDFANFQRTQSALLKSYSVLRAALEKPEVAALREVRAHADPVAWLQKALVTDYTLGPEVLRVTLNGDHADETALLLNEVARAYLAEVARKDEARVGARIKQLQENYRHAAEALRGKRLKLRAREQELDIDDPETLKARHASAMGQLGAAQAKRLALRLDLKQAEVELAAEQARAAAPAVPALTEAAVDDDLKQSPLGARLLADLALAQQCVQQTTAVTTPEARAEQLKGPLARQAALVQALEAQRAEVRARLAARLKAKARADARDNIARLENKIQLYRAQQTTVEGELKRLEAQVAQLRGAGRGPEKTLSELDALRDEVGQTEIVLKKVGDELGTLQAESPVTPRVGLLEEAAPPVSKKVDRQVKLAGVAAAGLFACVLLGVALLETRGRRVYAVEDVAGGLAMGVVGTLPALPASARGAVPQPGHAAQGAMTEAIDAIRTVLLHSPQGEAPRVLMVASALGGEGKTTLATHLAASLARAWRKTLLIDGDLRKPGAHRQFDLAVEPGLSEALRDEVEYEDAVRPTPVSRLWLLPAGRFDSHAVQALAQEGVRNVFERLKEEYDFIVIDTSPVLPVADALLVAQHADAALFAVLRDVSRVPAVRAAHQRLAALGVRLLGAVVIGEEAQTYGTAGPYPRQA